MRATIIAKCCIVLSCAPSAGTNPETGTLGMTRSHLVFEQTAGLWSEPDGTQVLQIDVVNDGEAPSIAPTGIVEVLGKAFTAELIPRAPDGAAPRSLAPHERGYLQVRLWGDAIQRCTELSVLVRRDPTLANDEQPTSPAPVTVKTPCLTWKTPLDARAIPALRNPALDQAAVKAAAGKTLDDIVSSRKSGRADGKLCSDCHFATSLAKYNPAVPQGAANLAVAPTLSIVANQDPGCANGDGSSAPCALSWADPTRGWAVRFDNTTTYPSASGLGPKPAVVRAAFSQWLADGAR